MLIVMYQNLTFVILKITIILSGLLNWDIWISVIRHKALNINIWKYIDLNILNKILEIYIKLILPR